MCTRPDKEPLPALIIHEKDNVAILTAAAEKGDLVRAQGAGRSVEFRTLDPIPVYHKAAVVPIPEGAPVVKYGEHIGIADADIPAGAHVHLHNVRNNREDLASQV